MFTNDPIHMHYEPAVHPSNIIYLIPLPAVSVVGVNLLHCLVIFPIELVFFSAYKEFIISYRSQAFHFCMWSSCSTFPETVSDDRYVPRQPIRCPVTSTSYLKYMLPYISIRFIWSQHAVSRVSLEPQHPNRDTDWGLYHRIPDLSRHQSFRLFFECSLIACANKWAICWQLILRLHGMKHSSFFSQVTNLPGRRPPPPPFFSRCIYVTDECVFSGLCDHFRNMSPLAFNHHLNPNQSPRTFASESNWFCLVWWIILPVSARICNLFKQRQYSSQ